MTEGVSRRSTSEASRKTRGARTDVQSGASDIEVQLFAACVSRQPPPGSAKPGRVNTHHEREQHDDNTKSP